MQVGALQVGSLQPGVHEVSEGKVGAGEQPTGGQGCARMRHVTVKVAGQPAGVRGVDCSAG
jgi:hypothetical protein